MSGTSRTLLVHYTDPSLTLPMLGTVATGFDLASENAKSSQLSLLMKRERGKRERKSLFTLAKRTRLSKWGSILADPVGSGQDLERKDEGTVCCAVKRLEASTSPVALARENGTATPRFTFVYKFQERHEGSTSLLKHESHLLRARTQIRACASPIILTGLVDRGAYAFNGPTINNQTGTDLAGP